MGWEIKSAIQKSIDIGCIVKNMGWEVNIMTWEVNNKECEVNQMRQ